MTSVSPRVDNDGERKKTLCGTPDYVAPEMLALKGHSFEVDIWSIGCILYTLLVGHPPFHSPSMKETFIRIKKNEYHLPAFLSSSARNLIQRLLQLEPERRPKVEAILEHEFITCGPLPRSLPTSCLAEEPRFDALISTPTYKGCSPLSGQKEGRVAAQGGMQMALATSHQERGTQRNVYLKELQCLVWCVCNARPPELPLEHPGMAEDPASVPVFWVSKWIDYTEKYGFGYQLCDNSIGVRFNDRTSVVLLNNNL